MITFGNKLNRCYSLYLPLLNTNVVSTIYFHKGNTLIEFKYDHNNTISKSDNISVITYKDLKKSIFASTFLEISDFSSDTLSIKNQFSNVKSNFKEKIQYLANESIKLSKYDREDGKSLENLLYLYAFTFTDYDNEFIYILAERQHIDTVLSKKFVRTCGFQISTQNCINDMLKIAEHYRGVKLDNYEIESQRTTEEQLKELFQEKHANVKRL